MAVGPVAAAALAAEVPVETGKRQQIPRWLRGQLTESDLVNISAAIVELEKKTSGEVVPMIVGKSTFHGLVPWVLCLAFFAMSFLLDVHRMPLLNQMGAVPLVVYFVSLFFLAQVLSRWGWLQNTLLPRQEREIQIAQRALSEFHQTGIVTTKDKTGVFLFLSILEKKAIVLADEGIARKLPTSTWDQICQIMIQAAKNDRLGDGLVAAIKKSGDILAEHFPAQNGVKPKNELANELIIKE